MKTKKVYAVETAIKEDNNIGGIRYLLPSEFHLIRTMLNDGITVNRVYIVEMNEGNFKYHFG